MSCFVELVRKLVRNDIHVPQHVAFTPPINKRQTGHHNPPSRPLPSLNSDILFYRNSLAIYNSFPYITDINVNDGHKLIILNLISFNFCRAYLYLKSHILLYSSSTCNGLAIWHDFSDITHTIVIFVC